MIGTALPCPIIRVFVTYACTKSFNSFVLLKQDTGPALPSVLAAGGRDLSPILMTTRPSLPSATCVDGLGWEREDDIFPPPMPLNIDRYSSLMLTNSGLPHTYLENRVDSIVLLW